MNRREFGKGVLVITSSGLSSFAAAGVLGPLVMEKEGLQCIISDRNGLILQMESRLGAKTQTWLKKPVSIQVRNEVTGASAVPISTLAPPGIRKAPKPEPRGESTVKVAGGWTPTETGLRWDLAFEGNLGEGAHEVILDFPVLGSGNQIFTPTERGVMNVEAYPSFKPVAYGSSAWKTGRYYVLPLISVWDPESQNAITIALAPDQNIPYLQFEWIDQERVRVHLGHRDFRPGKPKTLSLVFYAHPADYRSVLRSYSTDFPDYFKPPLPRGEYEGSFYYHHIQDHPAFKEMASEGVRYIWASFWFPFLGDYMPEEKEWYPYTYARWWKLKQMIGDADIRSFIKLLHEHQIGTFAYFNVTEYGGAGGKNDNAEEASRLLQEKFSDSLVKDSKGQTLPTWEGAKVMNPGPHTTFFPYLMDQVRRHLKRLPQLEGFCIDRLDWSSIDDYSHQDGVSMIGNQQVENLAQPVAGAVQAICRLAHADGKRVYVNQFWRLEVLKDVDGYCHEYDYTRGLGYVSPYRPASAWEHPDPYLQDMLRFEAKLKIRLQFAIFPQMIAHTFPISQQKPDPKAADLLQVYTPLFNLLHKKEQVLLPHCVAVTGANDANLFKNAEGHYVAPVTSRLNFISGARGKNERTVLELRVPDHSRLTWAHVYSAEGRPYRASLSHQEEKVEVTLPQHLSASVVLAGKGAEPPLKSEEDGLDVRRQALLELEPRDFNRSRKPIPAPSNGTEALLVVSGKHVGAQGFVTVKVNGKVIGKASDEIGPSIFAFNLESQNQPRLPLNVELVAGDEGTWFVPDQIELRSKHSDGKNHCLVYWTPEHGLDPASDPEHLKINLRL
ncbi:MAG: hypothetical protein M1404_05520 [Acidobacteria bacterium]|nr:hypothetical protein [Acidobacteriota bacterium]